MYEDDLRLRYGKRTVPDYLRHVLAFLDSLAERGLELMEVGAHELQAYQSALLSMKRKDGKPYSLGNQHGRLTAVKSLFRFLYRGGYTLQDPSRMLDYHLMEKRLPRVILTEAEARRLLESADEPTPEGLRDRAILEVLYGTGIRATELANLTVFDVDTEDKTLRVVLGKGRKDRNVPLTEAACEALNLYLESGRAKLCKSNDTRFLFLSNRGGWLHRAILSRIVARYVKRARIRKPVSAHTLRHTVASHLLKGGADIRHIQKLLGHGSLQTTELYTRVEISDLRKVMARAHPRG